MGSYLVRRKRLKPAPCRRQPSVTTQNTAKNCHLHPAGRRAQPHRHVRSEGRERHHARRFQSDHRERHQLAHGPAAEDGRATGRACAIVRSMHAWALVHSAWRRRWTQIGRNPAAALGNIAPNIGSVVAIEKSGERLRSGVPDVPGAELAVRRRQRIFPGDICAVPNRAVHHGHSRTPPIRWASRASTSSGAACTSWTILCA